MFSPEERRRAVDLYSATSMTTTQVVRHLGHPTRQCLERWLAKDPRYAGHMAKPIIPLEAKDQGNRTGAGRHARKRAAERFGAGVGAVNHWVKAYREDGLTAHVPERRGYGSYGGETTPAPGNLADRDFTVGMPNGKWLMDITRDQGPGREGRASRRRSTATAAGSSRTRPVGPNAGLADRMLVNTAGGSTSLGAFRPRMPLPVAWMSGAHGPLRPGAVDGREGLFPGQRRRGGVLRTHEDGIRPSRALGGAPTATRCSSRSTTASAGTTTSASNGRSVG